jgi:hypothetical protein
MPSLIASYPVLASLEAWELLLMSERNQPHRVKVISVEPHLKDLLTYIIAVSWGPTATGMGRASLKVPRAGLSGPGLTLLLLAFMVDVYNLQKGERSEMRGCGQEF